MLHAQHQLLDRSSAGPVLRADLVLFLVKVRRVQPVLPLQQALHLPKAVLLPWKVRRLQPVLHLQQPVLQRKVLLRVPIRCNFVVFSNFSREE